MSDRTKEEGRSMRELQIERGSGLAVVIGAAAFVVHIVARSVITASAGGDALVFAGHGLWIPTNATGAIGAMLVVLGLPGIYARIKTSTSVLGLIGSVLITAGWMIVGVFLSLYSALVVPRLANNLPARIDAINQDPALVITFALGLFAQFTGTVVLAIACLGGQARWLGYTLLASALMVVLGDFLLAPNGPAPDLMINLLSNTGPVLLMTALAGLGYRVWREPSPPERRNSTQTIAAAAVR